MDTDVALLNAAKNMDQEALVRIFDLYSSPLYSYALRLCGDPILADHIVGDVFAKLLDQISAGNGPKTNLRSYLYETTYHRIVDEARYSKRRVPLEVAGWLQRDPGAVFSAFEDQILFKQILHAIRNDLTHDQRHVVVLRFLEQLSLRETATILGITVEHVKVIQGRALAKLRQSLERRQARNTRPSAPVRPAPKALGV